MDEVKSKTKVEASFMMQVATDIIKQFENKNTAYGDSFGKQFKKYGPISALVRINDKFTRLESLILGAENRVEDERLEDTLGDLACYCLMTLYEIQLVESEKMSQNVQNVAKCPIDT